MSGSKRKSTQDLVDLFVFRAQQAAARVPALFVSLRVGDPAQFPKPRDYAFCVPLGGRQEIVVSPKIFSASRDRQEGLIQHELGHAMLMALGRPHTERQCDAFAEETFGSRIYYDVDDVQTTAGGARPRPPHLHTGEENMSQKPLSNPIGKKFGRQVSVVRMMHGERRHIQNPNTGLTLCNPRSTEKRTYTVMPVIDPEATVDCYRCIKLAAINQERRGHPLKVSD